MRPLFVGEQPSHQPGPDGPLAGRAGTRLARLAGITLTDYLAHSRVNLISHPGEWDRDTAARTARELDYWIRTGRPFVLLGGRVAAAFRVPGLPNTWDQLPSGRRVLRLPHPSGRNRLWNDSETTQESALRLRQLLNG